MDKEDLHCHYTDLPSPMAYLYDTTDYDGMGNYGRFPKPKRKKNNFMKRFIQKIFFWWSIKKSKNKNKSIWDLQYKVKVKLFKKILSVTFKIISLPFILVGGIGAILFIIGDTLEEDTPKEIVTKENKPKKVKKFWQTPHPKKLSSLVWG